MNKKTLIFALVVPFIVAILTFTNITIIKNTTEVDIFDIEWGFKEHDAFKVREEGYSLVATPVTRDFKISEGNDLTRFFSANKEKTYEDLAEIKEENGAFYLYAYNEGEVSITCSNTKGTVSKSFIATLYENAVIVINPTISSSGNSITQKRNFGVYDIKDNKLVNASLSLEATIYSDDINDTEIKVTSYDSSKISLDVNKTNISIGVKSQNIDEPVDISFVSTKHDYVTGTYSLNLISNGVNVYNYNDLLYCTNKSENGEIVVLQKNLESEENYKEALSSNKNNTERFGNSKASFKNEVYTFSTLYNKKYIEQINGKNSSYEKVVAGIRVQKDFYGNGFTINGRDLTYPTGGINNVGKLIPGDNDLFKGPLTYYSIGNFDAPIIKAYGQDNTLMYVDGDNITIDDLIIECTDKFNDSVGTDTNVNNMYNLDYVGSVIDCLGKNITISNSEIKNGRNNLRVYSSNNFTLKNSILTNAREFLLKVGCNEYNDMEEDNNISMSYNGTSFNGTLANFMTGSDTLNADYLVKDTLFDLNNKEEGYTALNKLQSYLDNEITSFGQEINIVDSYFYRSGIFSIGLDTYFNGCFLYDGTPEYVMNALAQIQELMGSSLQISIDITRPNNIGGAMAPSKVNISGDTRFYDWKNIDSIDASCLVGESLTELINSIMPDASFTIDIDSYFPMKKILKEIASKNGYVYTQTDANGNEVSYVNTPIAYYGGGKNNSVVNFENVTNSYFSDNLDVDILYENIFNGSSGILAILGKCVPVAIGFNKFKFVVNELIGDETPYLFGSSPSRTDLINRYEGE